MTTNAKARAMPACPMAPPDYASTMTAPGPMNTRKNVPIASAARRRALPSPGIVHGSGRDGGLTAGTEMDGELVGQVARPDRANGLLHVILHPDELHAWLPSADLENHISGPPVAVLGAPDAAGVDEVHTADLAVPRLVGVAEGDHVARPHPGVGRHLEAEVVGPVLGPVQRVQRRRAVDQHDPRSGEMAAVGQQVDAERQA